ncbi:hypothetical protein HHI36_007579 [Cryptolaemus montrouzieri]|uniref:Uncharacterized protein n=1 Tax=Cryptolaemus montrouzieri TaxID=559131 RepID=A0ABD2MQ40_9CUCU
MGIGLRQHPALIYGDRDYSFDAKNPMKPTGFDTSSAHTSRLELLRHMYGISDITSTDFTKHVPAHCTNHELALQGYFTVFTPKDGVCGFPPYSNICSEFNGVDSTGSTILEMDYHFHNAPLTQSHSIVIGPNCYGDAGQVNTAYGTEHIDSQIVRSSRNVLNEEIDEQSITAVCVTDETGKLAKNTNIADHIYHKLPLEQSGTFNTLPGTPHTQHHQPSIHIGIKPVPQLSTATNSVAAMNGPILKLTSASKQLFTVKREIPFTILIVNPSMHRSISAAKPTEDISTLKSLVQSHYDAAYYLRRDIQDLQEKWNKNFPPLQTLTPATSPQATGTSSHRTIPTRTQTRQ